MMHFNQLWEAVEMHLWVGIFLIDIRSCWNNWIKLQVNHQTKVCQQTSEFQLRMRREVKPVSKWGECFSVRIESSWQWKISIIISITIPRRFSYLLNILRVISNLFVNPFFYILISFCCNSLSVERDSSVIWIQK